MEVVLDSQPIFSQALIATSLMLGSCISSLRGQDPDKKLEEVLAILDQAESLRRKGKLPEALQMFDKAMTLGERVLDSRSIATGTILGNVAMKYREMGELARAETLLLRSLKIKEEQVGKDHLDITPGLNNLAVVYVDQGKFAQAEALYQRSLQIMEAKLGKDHADVATLLNNQGLLLAMQGEFNRAEPVLQRCLRIRRSKLGEDHPEVAGCLNNLAMLYRQQGQYSKAEPLFQRSLEIKEVRLGRTHLSVAISLNNLAWLYQMQGRHDKAEPLAQRSHQIREANLGKDHPSVAISLHNQARLSQAQGDFEKAERLQQRGLEILETKLGKDHPHVAASLNNLALLYQAQGQYAKAKPLLQRSLLIAEAKLGKHHPDVAMNLNSQAILHAGCEEWDEAAQFFDRDRQSLAHHVLRVLPGLSAYEQLDFLGARVTPGFWAALSLALLRREDGKMPELSAAWLCNGKALTAQALAQPLLQARDANRADLRDIFEELRQTRNRLARLTLSPSQPGLEARRRERLAELSKHEDHLVRRLGQESGRDLERLAWVELGRVRRTLPADAVLIDLAWFWTVDFPAGGAKRRQPTLRCAAWVIPAEGKGAVQSIDLGEAKQIADAAQAVRRLLETSPRTIREEGEADAEKELQQGLRTLSRLLVEPLQPHIGQFERWVVSPDGAVWLTPWEMLLLKDGSYVIEKHRLSYAVSGRDLAGPASKTRSSGALVLADPDFDLAPIQAGAETVRPVKGAPIVGILPGQVSAEQLGRFGRLPGTRAEVAAITPRLKTLLKDEPITVRTGKEALEAVFKAAKSPRILVLSTHGFFLTDQVVQQGDHPGSGGDSRPLLTEGGKPLENPLLRCGLALAGANQRHQITDANAEDGILTGLEILGTDLRGTELVVLSACETGLGQVNVGEGVAGLRQAFQLAGAQAVLASLWQVEDRETARLMSHFFSNLAQKKSKAEALREAQLAIIKARRQRDGAAHPFYWAAFTLTGQP